MKISEIVNLITIRNYVANSINNHSIRRDVVNELNKTLILLDKTLTDEIIGDAFKNAISFENADAAVKEVIKTTNIKNGMNKTEKIVVIEEGMSQTR